MVQLTPYFAGEVVPLCDEPLQDEQQVSRQVEQLSQTVRVSVHRVGLRVTLGLTTLHFA